MRQTLQFAFGFRPDLALSQKWWHRLAQVAFTLSLLVGVIAAIAASTSENPGANASNSRILTDVVAFTDANRGVKNTLPEFLALEGRLGRRMMDGAAISKPKMTPKTNPASMTTIRGTPVTT